MRTEKTRGVRRPRTDRKDNRERGEGSLQHVPTATVDHSPKTKGDRADTRECNLEDRGWSRAFFLVRGAKNGRKDRVGDHRSSPKSRKAPKRDQSMMEGKFDGIFKESGVTKY